MDWAIVELFLEDIKNTTRTNLRDDPASMVRLKLAAEKAKMELSNLDSTNVTLHSSSASEILRWNYTLTRMKLEELAAPMISKLEESVGDALESAEVPASAIDRLILVGGMTRIPFVRTESRDWSARAQRRRST